MASRTEEPEPSAVAAASVASRAPSCAPDFRYTPSVTVPAPVAATVDAVEALLPPAARTSVSTVARMRRSNTAPPSASVPVCATTLSVETSVGSEQPSVSGVVRKHAGYCTKDSRSAQFAPYSSEKSV